ncbi:hypothetical protein RND71_005882 [Anisodus tanguticus]|uniref:Cytochrome P450 n=1 Tax=Anisodus tanguticus TaxID=243964 RepID=A0AAE1VVT4_9SOLA|nr:hypothetical protein RND71_005882 [Anisodus tanguticus]
MSKQVLNIHDLAFARRPQFTSTDIVMYNNKGIAFAEYGDYWKQISKICIMELLSAKMVKSLSSIEKMSSRDMFIAGTETSSTTIIWALSENDETPEYYDQGTK